MVRKGTLAGKATSTLLSEEAWSEMLSHALKDHGDVVVDDMLIISIAAHAPNCCGHRVMAAGRWKLSCPYAVWTFELYQLAKSIEPLSCTDVPREH